MIPLIWSRRHSAVEIDNANQTDGIGRKSARGSIVSIGSNVAKAMIQIVITAILSRLLSIDDYGVMAMSSAVMAFFTLFTDMGMGGATMQRRYIDHQMVSTLFWISCVVGLSLFLICTAMSPLLAMFYRDSRLIPVVIVCSLAIPLSSVSSQHRSILARQGRWTELNATLVVTQILGGILAIAAAWSFHIGYWALALQNVSATAMNSAAYWLLCKWRPGRGGPWREAKSAFSFGGYLMLFNAVNYAHRQGDNLIVGRDLGAAALGLYSRGYNLFMLPLTIIAWPIASVITPLLARQQDDPERFALSYKSALASVYLLTAPVAGGFILFAEEAVTILYGAKWVESAAVLRILAIAILWQPAYTSGGWIDIGLGRSKRQFQASLFTATTYVTSFIIGVRYGILGMATAYVAANTIIIIPWLWWTSRNTLITLGGMLVAVRGSIVALAAAMLVTWLAMPHLPGIGFANFLVQCSLYGAVYLAVILIFWKTDRSWSSLIQSAISKLRS